MTIDYAIITTGGHQHRVRPGDTISVQTQKGEVGEKVIFNDVLLTHIKGETIVGLPYVTGGSVTGEIISHGKGKKVISLRYKNKTRHRVKTGHRQPFSSIAITNIKKGNNASRKKVKVNNGP
tara:strand:- start:78 stop:443 length:366 start_codon:yes stop_codon:yes gene_type:complete